MATQAVSNSWWRSLKHVFSGASSLPDMQDHAQVLTVSEANAYTLPRATRRIRVIQGGAWVSHRRQDLVVEAGQTLHLLPDHEGAVVTSIGRFPVEIEIDR